MNRTSRNFFLQCVATWNVWPLFLEYSTNTATVNNISDKTELPIYLSKNNHELIKPTYNLKQSRHHYSLIKCIKHSGSNASLLKLKEVQSNVCLDEDKLLSSWLDKSNGKLPDNKFHGWVSAAKFRSSQLFYAVTIWTEVHKLICSRLQAHIKFPDFENRYYKLLRNKILLKRIKQSTLPENTSIT